MSDKLKNLKSKQSDLLYAVWRCAQSYISKAPTMIGDVEHTRATDFVAGYLKAMKDCGYDITDEKTLANIIIAGDA